jgi:asparagine synthase (glutamine-hydrolysing)
VEPALKSRINDEWLGDFVAGVEPTVDGTLYADIRRLPPGHSCVVTADDIRLWAYYRLEERAPVTPRDRSSQFIDLMKAAIECRIAGPAPVCAMLSGGLDSSSIASLAAPMLRRRGEALTTISLVYPDTPEHDERPYIDAVVKTGNIEPIFLDSGRLAPFADFGDLLHEQDGPFIAPNLAASRRIHHAAAARGFRVILDGHGGDETIAHGGRWLADLAYRGRWIKLWRELSRYGAIEGFSPRMAFLGFVRRRGPHRKLARKALGFARRLRGQPAAGRPRAFATVAPGLAQRARMAERHPVVSTDPSVFGREERRDHYETLVSPLQSYALEILDHTAAAAGVEVRFPLLDKRLIEFCLSLPAGERMGDGYTRQILRRSLSGVLPEAIRTRSGKLNFTPHIVRGLLDHHRALIDRLLSDEDKLGSLVNLPPLRLAWDRIQATPAAPDGYDVQAVWRAATLGQWLHGDAAPRPADDGSPCPIQS